MPTTVERTGEEVETLEIDPRAQDTPAGDPSPDPQQPQPKEKPDESLREMRRALKETRETLKQSNEAARFWMEQARGGGGAKKGEPEPEAEPKISVDLVEAITNGDTKAIAKAMRELGFVSVEDMKATISTTRREVTAEQKLVQRYPDLDDEESEMFKVTAQIYNELSRDPDMARSKALAATAARMAAKELGLEDERPASRGSRTSRAARPDPEFDDDPDDDEERDRVERVARQTGDRGRRAPQGTRENSDELDPIQKSIIAKLRAAGADISEDGYRKRAKAGVRMAGLPTRRPRY